MLKTLFSQPAERATWLSWLVTFGLMAAIAAGGAWLLRARNASAHALPTPIPTEAQAPVTDTNLLPAMDSAYTVDAIARTLTLETEHPERPRYNPVTYTIKRGDSIFAIAKTYDVTPETVLWANYETLNDDPHAIKPGQVLNIPPTNGVYYQWTEGDTVEAVAGKFKSTPDDILNWPGNNVDLTNPSFEVGQWVMIPGGSREFKQWLIPTVARGASGTSSVNNTGCSGGAVGSGAFVWPANNRFLSGNDYWSGHLALDIAAAAGEPIYAADAGVVTMASGGWNYGYGNVVMIDHGNGYATLYAHLSNFNVGRCQSVAAGQVIGASGNTGNSFGAHLHFEVRQGGGFINPWYVLPPP